MVSINGLQQTFNVGQFTGAGANQGATGAAGPTVGSGSLNGAGGTPLPGGSTGVIGGRELVAVLLGTDKGPGVPDASDAQMERMQNMVDASLSGDDTSFLAKAMIKAQSERRHAAVLEQQTDGLAAQQETLASAAQLDKEASKMDSAAVVSLVTTVVSSALSIATSMVGGAVKLKGLSQELKAMKSELGAFKQLGEVNELAGSLKSEMERGGHVETEVKDAVAKQQNVLVAQIKQAKIEGKEAEKLATIGDVATHTVDALGKITASAGEFYSKTVEADVKRLDADSKRLDAAAQMFTTQADAKKAVVEAIDSLIQNVMTFIKDMADAKADRMQSIVRG